MEALSPYKGLPAFSRTMQIASSTLALSGDFQTAVLDGDQSKQVPLIVANPAPQTGPLRTVSSVCQAMPLLPTALSLGLSLLYFQPKSHHLQPQLPLARVPLAREPPLLPLLPYGVSQLYILWPTCAAPRPSLY